MIGNREQQHSQDLGPAGYGAGGRRDTIVTVQFAVLVICGHQEKQARDKLLLTNCVGLYLLQQQFSEVQATLFNNQGHLAYVVSLRGASLEGKEQMSVFSFRDCYQLESVLFQWGSGVYSLHQGLFVCGLEKAWYLCQGLFQGHQKYLRTKHNNNWYECTCWLQNTKTMKSEPVNV